MLHHAVFGSMGRFIGILLEQHQGRLPFWLAPVQVAVLPVAEGQQGVAKEFRQQLSAAGLRPQLIDQAETLSRRLVSCHDLLIPVVAILGKREMKDGTVSLRSRQRQWMPGRADAVACLSEAAAAHAAQVG
jgi:threonyl-tRNA synthetase